jgi:hypothetical protein
MLALRARTGPDSACNLARRERPHSRSFATEARTIVRRMRCSDADEQVGAACLGMCCVFPPLAAASVLSGARASQKISRLFPVHGEAASSSVEYTTLEAALAKVLREAGRWSRAAFAGDARCSAQGMMKTLTRCSRQRRRRRLPRVRVDAATFASFSVRKRLESRPGDGRAHQSRRHRALESACVRSRHAEARGVPGVLGNFREKIALSTSARLLL